MSFRTTPGSPPSRRLCGMLGLAVSLVLWLVVTLCFFSRWDSVSAVTIFPHWSWALLGILCAGAALRILAARNVLLVSLLWLGTTVCFADNLRPLLRGWFIKPPEPEVEVARRLRVITLNCAGSPLAAAEIVSFKPDLVLLQEIPTTNDLARLAQDLFGSSGRYAAGYDCAIIASGLIEILEPRQPPQFVQARVQLPGRVPMLVTSLRLVPPEGRVDLWNPRAWQASAQNRRLRRSQLGRALEALHANPEVPHVLGGDFNAPVSDAIFNELPGYRDSHHEAGRGWGNKAINSFPFARPDQIWVRGLHPISSRAIRSAHSDHRMVLAELEVR